MCGIAGEIRFKNDANLTDWNRISLLMTRRGPDDSGTWSDDRSTLVFRRLSILDLSPTGHQPMVSQDGRYVLVFNGEVYNFPDLRRQLEARGVQFRSSGDSEVVLYALIEWGTDALDRFNGMFALGFYDTREHRLLIARDHAGIKPLFYLHTTDGFAFGSQYDQLLSHPWSRQLGVSQDALALYLRLAYIPAPYAILDHTHMLEPGCWLEIDGANRQRQGRYYGFPVYEKPSLSGNEAIDAVDEAITNSVKRQMVSDVPLGAFLSGGIDSPLVIAKMLRTDTGHVHAFTIGTGGDISDESEDAIKYAQELGVEHMLEQVTPEQALGMLDNVVDACGEPFGDYSIFPTMLVSRLASRNYKVMLSGDGGDELFWGYAKRAGTLIGAANGFRRPHWQRTLQWGLKKILGIGEGRHVYHRYPSLGAWQLARHTHLKDGSLRQVFPHLPALPQDFRTFDFNGWEQDQAAQWIRWNEFTCHLPMVLQKVDRASMYHSLEVRVPLLDREVIETGIKVDWESCLDIAKSRGKLPLRACLGRHVRHQTEAKRGFEIPMGQWLRTSLHDVFREMVIEKDEIMGLEINHRAMSSLFDRHVKGQVDAGWGLWPLLSLALWSERYNRS